jgi:hypothetical protein
MIGRTLIGGAAAMAMLSVLAFAGSGASAPVVPAAETSSLPVPAPWRPSPAIRFAGTLTGLDQHVLDSHDRAGYVTASIARVRGPGLAKLRADAATAGRRVVRMCRCDLRGYRIITELPGRPPVVLASGAL